MTSADIDAVLARIIGTAESALGTRYVFGGNDLSKGVDCSGLIQLAYKSAGVNLPRVSADQAKTGVRLQGLSEARPGDLLSWDNSGRNVGADHIAIYLGDGKMLAASSGNGKVVVQPVYGKPQVNRVLDDAALPKKPVAVPLGPNADRTYTSAAVSRASVPAPTAPPTPGDSENGTPVASDKLSPQSTPAQIEAYVRAHYPDVAPYLENDEIRKVLFDGAVRDLPETEIEHLIRQTNYWQTTGVDSQRYDKLKATNPAEAKKLVDDTKQTLADFFDQQGVRYNDSQLSTSAEKSIRAGWVNTAGQIANVRALNDFAVFALNIQNPNGGLPAGTAASTADQLAAMAHDYMVPVNRRDLEKAALEIQGGKLTAEQFRHNLAEQSKSLFHGNPQLLSQIDGGQTPYALFAPQRTAIGNYFEVDPNAIDLTDSKWSEVLQMYDDQAKVTRPMTYGETQKWAMQNAPKNTQWYQQADATVANTLAKAFGRVA